MGTTGAYVDNVPSAKNKVKSKASVIEDFKPFHYFSRWLSHIGFNEQVKANWDNHKALSNTTKHFAVVVTEWNSQVYGSIGFKKKKLIAKLQSVQAALKRRRSCKLIKKVDRDLNIELETILDQEELLW